MEPRFVVRIVFRIWWMGSAGSRTICRIGVDSSQRRSATGQALSLRRDSVVGGVGGGDLEVLVAAGAQHGLVDAALSGLQVGGGKVAGSPVRSALQAAKEDPRRSPGDLIDPNLLGQWVTTAHSLGMSVVGWYLPTLTNPDRDLQHLMAMFNFQVNGQTLDGIGVDIESRDRRRRERSQQPARQPLAATSRAQTGTSVLSAIVVPPVVMDVINVKFWPGFPSASPRLYYNVWMPMNYWTGRTQVSGYHDGYRYTVDNITLLRQHVNNPSAIVHPIGGIADTATDDEIRGMVQGAQEQGAIGWSMYDWNTTAPDVDAGHPRSRLRSAMLELLGGFIQSCGRRDCPCRSPRTSTPWRP